jgi:glycosyltransferase involved in cell wall biosynthesis
MRQVVGFTVVPYRQIVKAEVLAESFLTAHPNSNFVLAVIDFPTRVHLHEKEGIQYLRVNELLELKRDFSKLALAMSEEHLINYVMPRVAKTLALISDSLIYLEPETLVLSELTNLLEASEEADLVLVPRRLTSVLVDGLNPTGEFIWQEFYDSGLFAINATKHDFVDWWCKQTELTVDLVESTKFGFLSTASTLFSTIILKDNSYGLSFLNFDERTLAEGPERRWLVDGKPLRSVYFKGYEPEKPFWSSSFIYEKSRFLLTSSFPHQKLHRQYRESLERSCEDCATTHFSADDQYGFAALLPGYELTPGIRHVYRTEWIGSSPSSHDIATPFGTQSTSEFLEWLEGGTSIIGPLVQRFVLAIFLDRPDIYGDFVHGNAVDYDGLGRWINDFGRSEYPISRLVSYRPPAKVDVLDRGRSKTGIDVIGSLNSEHGLGEAGRLLIEALSTTTEKISTISYSPVGVRGMHPFKPDNISENRTTVVALNPEQTRDLWNMYGTQFRKNRYVIGQWFWELEIAPSWYKAAFGDHLVDELWAPTRFIEQMLLNSVPSHIPVQYMPLPFVAPRIDPDFSIETLGLEQRFTFLFTFDFGSVMKRKNPAAVITAFKRAFKENEGPQLIIKSINGRSRQKEYEELLWSCEGRADIFLIDEYFDNDKNASLIASCDCYVSLHRSEGLGLTLAEAMLLEKPVIATNYSGNLDFMNAETGLLVPWQYTEVGKDAAAYPSHAKWAEPDIEVATEYMRYIYSNPTMGNEIGKRAREHVERHFSPVVTGAKMASRLREVRK